MDVTVRHARVFDSDSIRNIAYQSWHATYDHILDETTTEEFLDEIYDEDNLREQISVSERIFLVAETGNSAIMGFTDAHPRPDDGRTWELARIYVHPKYWENGIGKQLLQEIESEIWSRGGKRLQLLVMAENDIGIQFYESTGFEQADSIYDEYFDVPGYVYVKNL